MKEAGEETEGEKGSINYHGTIFRQPTTVLLVLFPNENTLCFPHATAFSDV